MININLSPILIIVKTKLNYNSSVHLTPESDGSDNCFRSGGEFQSEAKARLHMDQLPLRSVSWCHRLHNILDNSSVTVRYNPDISCIVFPSKLCSHTRRCLQSERKTTRPKVNQVRASNQEILSKNLLPSLLEILTVLRKRVSKKYIEDSLFGCCRKPWCVNWINFRDHFSPQPKTVGCCWDGVEGAFERQTLHSKNSFPIWLENCTLNCILFGEWWEEKMFADVHIAHFPSACSLYSEQ